MPALATFARLHRRVLVVLCSCLAAAGAGCSPAQKTFATPTDAANSLIQAMRNDDQRQLKSIFGPDGSSMLSSGDPVADRHEREVFVTAADQGWSLAELDGGAKELVIGHEEWPFPVPLVPAAKGWRFDTEAGAQEVLARRIGRNELSTIGLCNTYVAAQRSYASVGRDGHAPGAFAQRIRSTAGRQDGLYWPTSSGERASPLGSLAADASGEGYGDSAGKTPRPFRGYIFKILTAQGPSAQGGARSYISSGLMTGGFALVAYPASYRDSGVMTFIVNQDGTIYERDLGPQTAEIASKMSTFDPDATWHAVEG